MDVMLTKMDVMLTKMEVTDDDDDGGDVDNDYDQLSLLHFQGQFCFSSAELELTLMESDFETLDEEETPPSAGSVKASFNYLLLDPRVTRNLPARLNAKSSEGKKLAAFR